MRLYYNTNGFAHHRLDDAVDVLAELGYDGVALTPDVQHLDPAHATAADVDRLRRRLETRGLGVTVEGGARFLLDPRRKHWPTLLSSDGYVRRQEFYRRLLEIARDLGSPVLSIWSGTAEADTPAGDVGLDLLAERLLPVLEDAERVGVRLCFEPEPGMLVATMAQFEALHERLASRGATLWLTLDTGHLAAGETPPFEQYVHRGGHLLANVHVDDAPRGVHEHRFFGEGDLDLAALARAFHDGGYAGPLAVELSRHAHDAANVARRALAALTALGFRAAGPGAT